MTISSRTPEGDSFSCKVCGATDRVEPSPLTGDAVCPRCGGYLAKFLGHFEVLLSRPAIEAELAPLRNADSLDVMERVMLLEEDLGFQVNWDEVQRCRTVEDLVRYLAALRDGEE